MRRFRATIAIAVFATAIASAQRSPSVTSPVRDVVQPTLITPGSSPFHLAGVLLQGGGNELYGQVEMFWFSPDRYERILRTKDFSQTLVVEDGKVFENDSADYFPLELRTLVTAMVDPKPILDAVRDGDRVATKANGGANESGIECFDAKRTICASGPGGLREVVAAAGHSVTFADYQPFGDKQVARLLTNGARLGEDPMMLRIVLLEAIGSTPASDQMRFVTRSEQELLSAAVGSREIIWPQPLDGQQTGQASFYVSIDRAGNVREVQPLYTANERTNDSAVAQLMRWKFKPFADNGSPAQAEGVLTFTLNTREYGPAEPLRDAEARKLATGIVEPEVATGKYPPGTIYTLWIAVDTDGHVIEAMAGDGPHELWQPCYDAMRKWTFHPLMENGEPRPYRANLVFNIP